MKHVSNKKSSKRVILWSAVAVVLLLVIAAVAYCAFFSGKAAPRTSIAGESISGQTRAVAASKVTDRLNATKVSVEVDGEKHSYALSDLGIEVDVESTLDKAFGKKKNFFRPLVTLFTGKKVEPVSKVDEAKQTETINQLLNETGDRAENPKAVFDEAAGIFKAVEGKAGNVIDEEKVREAISKAVSSLATQEISLAVEEDIPTVELTRAQEVADKANEMIKLTATIQGREQTHEADAAKKASWVQIDTEKDSIADPKWNAENITAWVNEVSEAEKVEPKNGVKNVSPSGEVLATAVEAEDGYHVNNGEAVASDAVKALEAGENYAGVFEFDVAEATYEEKVVAEGAEKLAYAAAPGEKWLEINLGNNTTTAYEGATVVRGPMLIVPGMPGAETVTGKFAVYLKYPVQTMRGTHPDGSRYVVPDVKWVTYFHGGYAFHDAPWQSSFGWNGPGGSNGCINMTYSDSKFIFDWADMGTVVVSHY